MFKVDRFKRYRDREFKNCSPEDSGEGELVICHQVCDNYYVSYFFLDS